MIKQGSQALLTFYSGGRLASRGRNSGSKKDIQKITSFSGAINPETGKFEPVLNLDYYVKNKKPFPKHYWWDKKGYTEPTYMPDVKRKMHWNWDTHISYMLTSPVGMSEKQWNKLSDEEKIKLHAMACMLPGEYNLDIEIFI